MVGLTLLLEAQKSRVSKKSGAGSGGTTTITTPQILSKADMVRLFRAAPKRQGHTTGSSSSGGGGGFLEACYLCRRRLSPEKDIYMYRGDRAFCSVECRMRQIGMDEESMRRDKCGLVASAASSVSATSTTAATSSSSSSSSSSTARPRNGVVGKTRPGVPAGFAY